jgi:hypothetical protein
MTFKAIRCIAPDYVSNMFSHRQNNITKLIKLILWNDPFHTGDLVPGTIINNSF